MPNYKSEPFWENEVRNVAREMTQNAREQALYVGALDLTPENTGSLEHQLEWP